MKCKESITLSKNKRIDINQYIFLDTLPNIVFKDIYKILKIIKSYNKEEKREEEIDCSI